MPACQLLRANDGDSPQKSPTSGGTQCLHITPASQWLTTTTGRVAPDPYSWMQSVHWVGGSGLYTPTQTHGPKWGPTTLLIAQEISALSECRPSVDYLARKLRCSVRTVKYHLAMLREAGLLVYRSKGTRLTGRINQASVYERVIPAEFDQALGIRTIQRDETAPAHTRVPVGIADTGRKAIAKLARKAARKVRRSPRRTPVSGRSRCTPMQGGTSAVSSAGSTHSPSEEKLASGSSSHPTQKKSVRGPRKLNRIGRRYQLGTELVTNVPWLSRASAPRIAWITRHLADAGWSWHEVQAVAEEGGPIDPSDAMRPSGLLAHRIKGRHLLYPDARSRALMVAAWEDSRAQEKFRHAGWENSPAVIPGSRAADQAMAHIHATLQPDLDYDDQDVTVHEAGAVDITTLTREQVLEQRTLAAHDPEYVRSLLAVLGEHDTRRLLTNRIVDQALVLERLTSRTLSPAF
jgi:biotin operon repressor